MIGVAIDISTANLSQEVTEDTLGHVKLSQQVQSREHERDNIIEISGGEVHDVEFPAV